MENQVGCGYAMPNNTTMYIVSSRPLEDDEDDIYESIEGLYYKIHWGSKIFTFCFETQGEAMIAAVSIQWGVNNAS